MSLALHALKAASLVPKRGFPVMPLRSPHYRDSSREHLLHHGADLVELVLRLADRWVSARARAKGTEHNAADYLRIANTNRGGQND